MAFTVGTVGIHGSNDFFLPQNGMGHQLPPLSNFNVSSPTSTNTTVTNTTVSPSTPAANSSAPTSNEAPSSPPANQNATSPSRQSATPPQTNVYSYFNNVSSPNQYEGKISTFLFELYVEQGVKNIFRRKFETVGRFVRHSL